MKVRVDARKDEVKAISELLEDDSYDSSEKLARAVVTTTIKLMLERDWYVVASRNGGHNLLYGPLPSENAAMKALADESLGLGGEVGVFPVRSVSNRERTVEELDEPPVPPCGECGHPKTTHEFPKTSGCAVTKCNCTHFTK